MVMAAAGIAGAATIGGSVISGNAAQSAAKTQADAANAGAGNSLAMFNQIRDDLNPFRIAGQDSLPQLLKLMGLQQGGDPLSSPIFSQLASPLQTPKNPLDFADLKNTPGYQFTLDQGLKATQNSFAAQGLGRSGAALKGAGGYASGLADSTWKDVFNANLQTGNQVLQGGNLELGRRNNLLDILKMISGVVSGGQSAANQTGAFGTAAQTSANNLTVGAANANAAGTIGSANAISGGLSSLGNTAMQTALFRQIFPNSLGQTNPFTPAGTGSFDSGLSNVG